jgi:hypothetical protein
MTQLLALPDPTTPLGLRDQALLELLYATGVRISELAGLCLGQIDLQEGWVTISGAGPRLRQVPLGQKARAAVAAYLAQGRPQLAALAQGQQADASEGQPLLLNRWGTRLTDRSVRRILDRYATQLTAVGRVSPLLIRQSLAAHMLGRGADLAAVQESWDTAACQRPTDTRLRLGKDCARDTCRPIRGSVAFVHQFVQPPGKRLDTRYLLENGKCWTECRNHVEMGLVELAIRMVKSERCTDLCTRHSFRACATVGRCPGETCARESGLASMRHRIDDVSRFIL